MLGHAIISCTLMVSGLLATMVSFVQLESLDKEVLIWLLQIVTAAAWSVGGFLFFRLFKAVDSLYKDMLDHEKRLSRIEGRLEKKE